MGDLIKVAIIDDHRALTDALTLLINEKAAFQVTAVANNHRSGKKLIQSQKHDAYLVDLNLHQKDSYHLIELIHHYAKPAIVFSAYSDYHHIKKAMNAGAKGFISKYSDSSHIHNSIQAVLSGHLYFDDISQNLINNSLINFSNKKVPIILSELTKREKDVMSLIIQEYTSQEIASELHLSKNTIDGYRKELISKLGVKNSVGIANTFYKYFHKKTAL